MASLSYAFGVSVSRSFFDRLGIILGSILEQFWLPDGVYVEGFGGSILGLFLLWFSELLAGWPRHLRI